MEVKRIEKPLPFTAGKSWWLKGQIKAENTPLYPQQMSEFGDGDGTIGRERGHVMFRGGVGGKWPRQKWSQASRNSEEREVLGLRE